ncbi:MAG TPA: UGMP family protein, partial [Candidatus Thermoplasmatota archaeon]|nr:UGMP family protein [Candidatus Thermoplasmatota archaeon]
MITLGIEGTAHSIGIGIVENKQNNCTVLSNVIKTYRPETGGIHPREAANHHADHVASLIKQSLHEANTSLSSIDLV